MSGMVKISTQLAAAGANVNLLQGRKEEFLSRPAVVTLYQVQDQTAASLSETTLTLGNVVVGEDMVPNIPGALLGPRTNEDMVAQGVGQAGDRIQIRARETTGLGINVIRSLVTIVDI